MYSIIFLVKINKLYIEVVSVPGSGFLHGYDLKIDPVLMISIIVRYNISSLGFSGLVKYKVLHVIVEFSNKILLILITMSCNIIRNSIRL